MTVKEMNFYTTLKVILENNKFQRIKSVLLKGIRILQIRKDVYSDLVKNLGSYSFSLKRRNEYFEFWSKNKRNFFFRSYEQTGDLFYKKVISFYLKF